MGSGDSQGHGTPDVFISGGTSINESPPFVISSHLLSTSPATGNVMSLSMMRDNLMGGNNGGGTGNRPRSYSLERSNVSKLACKICI